MTTTVPSCPLLPIPPPPLYSPPPILPPSHVPSALLYCPTGLFVNNARVYPAGRGVYFSDYRKTDACSRIIRDGPGRTYRNSYVLPDGVPSRAVRSVRRPVCVLFIVRPIISSWAIIERRAFDILVSTTVTKLKTKNVHRVRRERGNSYVSRVFNDCVRTREYTRVYADGGNVLL